MGKRFSEVSLEDDRAENGQIDKEYFWFEAVDSNIFLIFQEEE